MRSDDKNDMPKVEDRAMAAPPRARTEDAPDRTVPRQAETASRDRPREERKPMTVSEQLAEENKKYFDEQRKKAAELTKEMESVQKEMDGARASNMKFWIVEPLNPDEDPYRYSNLPGRIVVVAPSERVARHMVFVAYGEAWRDESKVKVSEMEIKSPTIITRDFQG